VADYRAAGEHSRVNGANPVAHSWMADRFKKHTAARADLEAFVERGPQISDITNRRIDSNVTDGDRSIPDAQ
jgi:hypothetical protein